MSLVLADGEKVEEQVPVQGTPQELGIAIGPDVTDVEAEGSEEVEEVLERDGVRCRLLIHSPRPRLGGLVHLGVEIHPMERRKTGVAGLSAQPNAADTLRPLRRVRLEMFRRVLLPPSSSTLTASGSGSGSGSTSDVSRDTPLQSLNLMYTSGKSLRYPGSASAHPPLRVLFTLPTAQLGASSDSSYGEITQTTPYHAVSFFVRVTMGFGSADAPAPIPSGSGSTGSSGNTNPWVLEKEITIRPRIWKEPRQVTIEAIPASGMGEDGDLEHFTDEDLQNAYRLKGMDVVGEQGTYRQGSDLPPPFENENEKEGAGPSHTSPSEDPGLPTFLESQAQVRAGESSLPSESVPSHRLVPVDFEENAANTVGGHVLGGELGTWVEVGYGSCAHIGC